MSYGGIELSSTQNKVSCKGYAILINVDFTFDD